MLIFYDADKRCNGEITVALADYLELAEFPEGLNGTKIEII
jgi:hypothetical protein